MERKSFLGTLCISLWIHMYFVDTRIIRVMIGGCAPVPFRVMMSGAGKLQALPPADPVEVG